MFAAEPPQEPLPYGRWGEALGGALRERAARRPIGDIVWFPDRTWAGRTYVPATAPAADGGEWFGYVSYTREHEGAQAADFAAEADFTEETADENPDWTLDLSDAEIGHWRGPEGRRGVITLVWGVALVPNGVAATAELGPTPPTSARSSTTASRSCRSTPTRATTSRSACTARAGPSWRASRSTRTSRRRGARLSSCHGGCAERCVLLKFGELALKGRNRPRSWTRSSATCAADAPTSGRSRCAAAAGCSS